MFLKIIELKFERVATHEEIIHRQRNPRHVGRDGLVRPSIVNETLGNLCVIKRRHFITIMEVQ